MQRSRFSIISAATLATLLLAASVGTVAADTTPISIPPAGEFRTAPRLTVSPSVKLVGGVVATVHVDVVCDPMPSEWDPYADPTAGHSEGTTAQVVQAVSKRAIAAGESSGGGTFVCDGYDHQPTRHHGRVPDCPVQEGHRGRGRAAPHLQRRLQRVRLPKHRPDPGDAHVEVGPTSRSPAPDGAGLLLFAIGASG